MKIFLALIFLFIAAPVFSQDIFQIKNGIEYDESRAQPFLNLLKSKNDFVIAFRTFFQRETAADSKYFILAGNEGKLRAYSYSGPKAQLTDLKLSGQSLDQIYKTFQQNELFTIRNEKDIPNFCAKKYEIYESYTYEFTILSGGNMKVLSYYSPEYYIEACYGISERQNIINSVAIINLYVH